MKVISILTLAMGVAGAVTMPALGASDVHLVTSIEALSRAPDGVRYAVTVRPVGGPAHAATLWMSTRRPAAWTGTVPGCMSNKDRTGLACDLGELRESERRTLRLVAKPGDNGPAEVPVIAEAGAANAPSVTSTLGVTQALGMRLAPSKAADESSGPDPSVEPSASQSVQSLESPGPSDAPEPSDSPAPSDSAAASAAASASADPSQSPEVVPPAVLRPPGRGAPSRPFARPRAPHRAPAASPGAAHAPTASPGPSHAPKRPPVIPHSPVIPHMPVMPEGAPAVPPLPAPSGPPGGMAGGPPAGPPVVPGTSASAALPQIAPQTSPQISPGTGISELNTLTPAGAMQAGRTSWATVIAVAVVAEAGLLWLITGLMLRRRRRTPKSGLHRRVRSPWLVFFRLFS